MNKKMTLPFTEEDIRSLKAGDQILLSGAVYTARDAAHKRLVETIKKGEKPPIPIKDQVLYYAGPAPTPKGKVIGAIGPTTSTRMDPYTPFLLDQGLKAMNGKGKRSPEVVEAIKTHQAIYFAAIGGTAALMAKNIVAMEVSAYEELGTESIKKLVFKDFPLIVVVDIQGNDYYAIGQEKYLSGRYNNIIEE